MAERTDGLDVVVTIQHPSNVHFFRNAIGEFEARGDTVHVFARPKDVACDLLEAYDIEYELLAGEAESLLELARVQARYEFEILRRVRSIRPDVMLAVSEPTITHASTCFDCRSLLFTDTEHATVQNYLAYPFADVICTPEAYWDDLGPSQVRYPGFHQLAYLHPDRFSPDPGVFDRLEVEPDEPFAVVRLVSWSAAHDIGQDGIGRIEDLVTELESMGIDVLLSAEGDTPPTLAAKQLTIPPEDILDVLAYADLFVGESGSMAIESAVLGTPTIYVSSLSAGVLAELETRFGLLRSYDPSVRPQTLLETASTLLDHESAEWERRRRRLLEETVDTTSFLVHLVDEVLERQPPATSGPIARTVGRVTER